MAKYVDVDAPIDFYPVKGWKETQTVREIAERNHGILPVADVVARDCYDRLLAENDRLRQERPVVRCRDCKHYDCEDGDQKCVKDAEWVEEDACYYGFISYHGPEFDCADLAKLFLILLETKGNAKEAERRIEEEIPAYYKDLIKGKRAI